MHQYYVYIMASSYHGTLYIGVTNDLLKRVWQHKHTPTGFIAKYKICQLIWFEVHEEILEAIRREKQLKKWNRSWKIRLIEETNPRWEDLWKSISGEKTL